MQAFSAVVGFYFADKTYGKPFCDSEKLFKCRYILSIGKLAGAYFGSGGMLDVYSVDLRVMIYDKRAVGSHPNVELRPPATY